MRAAARPGEGGCIVQLLELGRGQVEPVGGGIDLVAVEGDLGPQQCQTPAAVEWQQSDVERAAELIGFGDLLLLRRRCSAARIRYSSRCGEGSFSARFSSASTVSCSGVPGGGSTEPGGDAAGGGQQPQQGEQPGTGARGSKLES